MDGGGTANGNYIAIPYSANYYIGGKGNKTSEASLTPTAYDGRSEGGGLLVVYGSSISIGNNAKFASAGKTVNGSCWAYWRSVSGSGAHWYYSGGSGGGSGGGSINVFYKDEITGLNSSRFEVITGSYSPSGTYNVGTVKDGTYKQSADETYSWKRLLEIAGINYNEYSDFSNSLTVENATKITESSNAMTYIENLFKNEEDFRIIANNAILMKAICENASTRLAMYNNYKITESILATSGVALNAMQTSTRYQLISRSISKYAGEIHFTNMYNGKAFVLGMSQDRNTDSGFKTEASNFLSVSGGIVKATLNYTYGKTGLVYRINKFASTVNLDPCGRDPSYPSITITIGGYVAIFKI